MSPWLPGRPRCFAIGGVHGILGGPAALSSAGPVCYAAALYPVHAAAGIVATMEFICRMDTEVGSRLEAKVDLRASKLFRLLLTKDCFTLFGHNIRNKCKCAQSGS